jgi:hypothetical protein
LNTLSEIVIVLTVLWWVDVLSAHLSLDVEKKSPKCYIQGSFYWKSFLAICGFPFLEFFIYRGANKTS